MDLRSLDDMHVPADGIRLTSGRLERLAFDGRVRDGRAAGSVRGRYRDLGVENVDPGSGRPSLPDVVASLVLDADVRSDDPASGDEEPRAGTIENTRSPDEPSDPASGDQADDQHDEGDDQQQVDQVPTDPSDEAQQPQDQDDDEDRPEHRYLPVRDGRTVPDPGPGGRPRAPSVSRREYP